MHANTNVHTYRMLVLCVSCGTNLGRKRVALHAVLGAKLVVQPVVDVDLVESIAIGKWAAR